jgi:hypothetical protein
MAETRPKLEQIDFRSARTGTHLLDTYLESAEFGDRTLADLLNDIFDEDSGNVRDNIFEFRVDPTTYALQVRRGLYLDPEQNWVDVPYGGFFKPRGTYAVGTEYGIHDLIYHQEQLMMVTQGHTAVTTDPDPTKTFTIIFGTAGRIPATDDELSGNGGRFLVVKEDESGYTLTDSAAKPMFQGIKFDPVAQTLTLEKYTTDDDVSITPEDYDTYVLTDLNVTYSIVNNKLVATL